MAPDVVYSPIVPVPEFVTMIILLVMTLQSVKTPLAEELPVPTEELGVMLNSTSFWEPARSAPLAQTNVWLVPPGLAVKPAVPSPPEPAVAGYHVVPPSGLNCTWMLHGFDATSVNV